MRAFSKMVNLLLQWLGSYVAGSGQTVHPVLYEPQTRLTMGGEYDGIAQGINPCGDGTNSTWLTVDSGSKKMSAYSTHLLTVAAGSKITLWYLLDEFAPAIHQLQYCQYSDPAMLQPDLIDGCFRPLERSPDDVEATPYLAEYSTIDFVLEEECMAGHVAQNRPLRSVWLAPETVATGEPMVLRWVVQRYGKCCPSKAVCGKTIPQAIKEWVYDDPILPNKTCQVAFHEDAVSTCACPNQVECVADSAQVKLCIDAIKVTRQPGRVRASPEYIDYDYSGTHYQYLNRTHFWARQLAGNEVDACSMMFNCRSACLDLFSGIDQDTRLGIAAYCADIGQTDLYSCLEDYLAGAC